MNKAMATSIVLGKVIPTNGVTNKATTTNGAVHQGELKTILALATATVLVLCLRLILTTEMWLGY